MIRFLCTNCRQALEVAPQYAGQQARCTRCQQLMVVPAAPQPVAIPAPSAGGLISSIKQPHPSARPNLTTQVACPGCGHWLDVGEDQQGKLVSCSRCGRTVRTLPPDISSADRTPATPEADREQRLRMQTYLWLLGGGLLGVLFGTSIGVSAGSNIGGALRAILGIILGCGLGGIFVGLWAFRLGSLHRIGGWLVAGALVGSVLGATLLSRSELRPGALGGSLFGALLGTAAGYGGSVIWRRLDSGSS